MIEQEIRRLQDRMREIEDKIVPQLERRTEFLYSQIIPMPKDSLEREKLEEEYSVLSKELRMRSDERIDAMRQIERLTADLRARNEKPRLGRRFSR